MIKKLLGASALTLFVLLPTVSSRSAPLVARDQSLNTPAYAFTHAKHPKIVVEESKKIGTSRLVRLTYVSMNNQVVPALLFLPASASPHHKVPAVVILHGLGGNKELMASLALYFNTFGYAAFAIDEYGAGERKKQTSTAPSLYSVGSDLLTGIPQTVVDVRRGVDVLDNNPNIDSKRVGLLGISLGAIIGTIADSWEPRFKTFVAIAGGGDWKIIMKMFLANHGEYVGLPNSTLPEETLDLTGIQLHSVDPAAFAPTLESKSVFMINGALDHTIAPAAADALAKQIDTNTHPYFVRKVLADSGHVPSTSILNPMVKAWLQRRL